MVLIILIYWHWCNNVLEPVLKNNISSTFNTNDTWRKPPAINIKCRRGSIETTAFVCIIVIDYSTNVFMNSLSVSNYNNICMSNGLFNLYPYTYTCNLCWSRQRITRVWWKQMCSVKKLVFQFEVKHRKSHAHGYKRKNQSAEIVAFYMIAIDYAAETVWCRFNMVIFLLSRYQFHSTVTKATNELAHIQRVILCI